jgi:hypothetical protein
VWPRIKKEVKEDPQPQPLSGILRFRRPKKETMVKKQKVVKKNRVVKKELAPI